MPAACGSMYVTNPDVYCRVGERDRPAFADEAEALLEEADAPRLSFNSHEGCDQLRPRVGAGFPALVVL
jgi:hypothetical protein